jgi:hypothetical protein
MSVGVDRMLWNFEPMRKQVEAWQRSEFTDVTAKVVINEAFVEGKREAPKNSWLAPYMTCTSSRGTRNSGPTQHGIKLSARLALVQSTAGRSGFAATSTYAAAIQVVKRKSGGF